MLLREKKLSNYLYFLMNSPSFEYQLIHYFNVLFILGFDSIARYIHLLV